MFNSVGTDMKLKETIQRSRKGAGGVIRQTKSEKFVSEWDLVYHETIAIVNSFADVTKLKSISDSSRATS